MHLRRKRGWAPWFPYEEFRAQQRDVRTEWKTAEDLQTAAGDCADGGKIVARIGPDAAQRWLGWEHGELYAVGYGAKVLFCLPEGTVWVGQLRL